MGQARQLGHPASQACWPMAVAPANAHAPPRAQEFISQLVVFVVAACT